jgi:uncharacterized protein YbcI
MIAADNCAQCSPVEETILLSRDALHHHSVSAMKTLRPHVSAPSFAKIMITSGEIEAAVSQGMSRFEQEYMGRGPKDVRTHLIGDLLLVRLQGVMTAAEQHLVKTLEAGRSRDLLKQVRIQLIESARPTLEVMIRDITGVKVLSLHYDISTATGEAIVVFTLSEPPLFRETKKK